MIVANFDSLPQWELTVISATVGAAVGAVVTTLLKRLFDRTKTQSDRVKDAAILLRRQASELLTKRNVAILSRSEWASLLPDPSLIDAALLELKAERLPGKDDWWEIRLSTPPDIERWRR